MSPFFPCPFLCASPCPPPLSPPCLSVHVGLWLPSAKNSVCHLRSAFAVLHLCHQTHTGSSGCGQALLLQVTTNKNAFIFRKLVPCSDSIDKVWTEFSVNQDLQEFLENIDEDQPGDEFRHHYFLNDLFSPHEIGHKYDT